MVFYQCNIKAVNAGTEVGAANLCPLSEFLSISIFSCLMKLTIREESAWTSEDVITIKMMMFKANPYHTHTPWN